jgi:serine protease Do
MRKNYIFFIFGFIVASFLMWVGIGGINNGHFAEIAFTDTVHAAVNDDRQVVNETITSSRQTAITKAVSLTESAIVSINVMAVEKLVQRNPFYRQDPLWQYMFPELFKNRTVEREFESLGSGFIISADGLVLTNEHVVHNAKEIVVTMSDGETYKAELLGVDPVYDVALLQLEGDNFPYLVLGDSDEMLIGEWVIAMGNPFGLFAINNKPTVTVGVVSAMDRDFGYLPDANKVYQDMIQTDAAINSGNSGGPLINATGEVIGINTFIYTGDSRSQGFVGIGFAIPINRIKSIVEMLQNEGKVDRHFYTGIEYREISAYWARRLNLGTKPLVVITMVQTNSPADKAGVKTGDVIYEVEDKTITNENDIIAAILEANLKVGDVMKIKVLRNKQEIPLQIQLVSLNQ